MIRIEFRQFQISLENMRESEKRIIVLAQELYEKTAQMKLYDNVKLAEQIHRTVMLADELMNQVQTLRQLIQAMQLAGRQYELTDDTVLRKCESCCLNTAERKIRTIDLIQTRKNMKDITFIERQNP